MTVAVLHIVDILNSNPSRGALGQLVHGQAIKFIVSICDMEVYSV
jgi:hypothetical protein